MLLAAAMLMQLQGCYGNFALTRKVYDWKSTLGDKWINSVVMFALVILPVYGACGIVEYVLFNPIQFWTGKNPVVLKKGEKDIQIVHWKGQAYKLTATTNRLDVQPMVDGKVGKADEAGKTASLVYDIRTQSWTANVSGEERKIIEMVGNSGQVADLIYPDGHKQRIELVAN